MKSEELQKEFDKLPETEQEPKKQDIEVIKPILEVFFTKNGEDPEPLVNWKFGKNINSYFLIGVLEQIKSEILGDIYIQDQEDEELA